MTKHPEAYWKLTGAELPTTLDNDAARTTLAERLYVRGWVYIAQEPDRNDFTGWVEHSFSMGDDRNHTRLWRRRADGMEDPDTCVKPGIRVGWPMQFTLYDIDEPICPVYLDWVDQARIKAWEAKHDRYDKFGTRNPRFLMKTDEIWEAQRAFLAALERNLRAVAVKPNRGAKT